jgi:hypothetical protein
MPVGGTDFDLPAGRNFSLPDDIAPITVIVGIIDDHPDIVLQGRCDPAVVIFRTWIRRPDQAQHQAGNDMDGFHCIPPCCHCGFLPAGVTDKIKSGNFQLWIATTIPICWPTDATIHKNL